MTKIKTAPHDLSVSSTKNAIRSDVDIAIYSLQYFPPLTWSLENTFMSSRVNSFSL